MGSNSNFPKLPFTQPGTTSEWLLYDIKEAFCKLVDEINNITPSGFICTDLLDCTIFTDRVMPAGGTTGQVLTKQSNADYDAIWETPTGGSAAWGAITGTLSDQTDLAAVLAIKLETVTHDTTLTGAGTVASPLSTKGKLEYQLLGKLIGANFNITTDQAITINGSTFIVTDLLITNASIDLDTAADGEINDIVLRGGNQIATTVSGISEQLRELSASNRFINNYTAMRSTASTDGLVKTNQTTAISAIYFSLGIPQGATAIADIYIFGFVLS